MATLTQRTPITYGLGRIGTPSGGLSSATQNAQQQKQQQEQQEAQNTEDFYTQLSQQGAVPKLATRVANPYDPNSTTSGLLAYGAKR